MTRSSPAPAPHSMKKPHRPGPRPQRGAAALIVVLLLFFVDLAGRRVCRTQPDLRAADLHQPVPRDPGLRGRRGRARMGGGDAQWRAQSTPPASRQTRPMPRSPASASAIFEIDPLIRVSMCRQPGRPTASRPNGRVACATAPAGTAVAPTGAAPTPADARRRRHRTRRFACASRRPLDPLVPPARRGAGGLHRPHELRRRPAVRRTWRGHRRRGRRDRERGRRVEQRVGDATERGADRARQSERHRRDASTPWTSSAPLDNGNDDQLRRCRNNALNALPA